MSESKSLANQKEDLFPFLGDNSLANNMNMNMNSAAGLDGSDDDDEDLDLDKMFAKYLEGMDGNQIKVLMEMGEDTKKKGNGNAKGKLRRRKRGDTEGEENTVEERLIDKIGGIESQESSSDDDEVGEVARGKSRPPRKGAVTASKSASTKSPTKKIGVKFNSGATEKGVGALRSSSSSSTHPTSKLKPQKTSATSHDSSFTSTPARPPQKRTLSKGATSSTEEAKGSSTLNSKVEKRSASSSKGATTSSASASTTSTTVGNHHGVGSVGVSIRPSLLPLRNTAKATPSSTTAAQGARGGAGTNANAKGGEGRLDSNNNNDDDTKQTAALGVAPKDRKRASSSPSQDEVDYNNEIRMYKEIIEKSEEALRGGTDEEEDEDESPSGEVSEEDNPAKRKGGQRAREPFRYEAQITLRKGPHIADAASTAPVGKNIKKDHTAVEAKFTFQDLVDAVISPDERTAKNTSEEISEALAIAKIVDLSGKNVSESDDVMCLDNVTTLYLQHNALAEVGGLSALMNLTVLVISHNAIESLSPLATLECLIFLDASWNNVSALDAGADLPSERLVELRLDHNPCAPDYELLERYDAKEAKKEERKGQKHAHGKAKKKRRKRADASGLVDDTETLQESDDVSEDNEENTSEMSEGEVAENFDYLEQYRAEILAACPLLRYLDGYEVASFAPEHVKEASIREEKPRLLADLLFHDENRSDFCDERIGVRGGKSGLSEEAVMRAVEDEVSAAIQRDLERGTDEDYNDYGDTHQTDTLDMENNRQDVTAANSGKGTGEGSESPAGLSELQSKLMAAYLELGNIKQGGGASSRPSTRMSTNQQQMMRPGSSSIGGGVSSNATISSLVGASSRPGTAGGGRPSTASKAALSVMALGKGGAPSSSRNKERNAKAGKEANGDIIDDGSSSSSDDDIDIVRDERRATASFNKVRGRVGSAPATQGGGESEHESDLIVSTISIAEDKVYAMVSNRQKELAKELVVAQRHRDKLAELGLMEFWENSTGELRALRVQAEDRRRRLLFGGNEEERPATSPFLLSSSSLSASVGGSVRRLQQALLHTKNNNSGSADTAKTEKDTASSANGNGTNREMQHSAGYLAALESLKKDAGIVGDINRYKRPMFDK